METASGQPQPTSLVLFPYKFNNGAPVVEDVAVYDGEESGDFAAEGCGVDNGVGGFNRTTNVRVWLNPRCGLLQQLPGLFKRFRGIVWNTVATVPGAGALGVGPNQGDSGWWSNNDGDVATRACLFDDIYAFNADGSFRTFSVTRHGWKAGRQALEKCAAPLWLLTTVQPLLLGLLQVPSSHWTVWVPSWVLPKCSMEANSATLLTLNFVAYVIESLTDDAMTLDIRFGAGWWRPFRARWHAALLYDLTLEVNSNIEVGPNGMYAGGGVLGDAQALALSDDDGDGIWSGTVSLPEGTSGNYIFLNSPTTVAIGENLDGLECSFYQLQRRILAPLTGNTTISTCFGQCSTDGTCTAPAETYDVTFQVDMSTYEGAFGNEPQRQLQRLVWRMC